ncbi:N-methyl-L-tryptophan oxidase [Muricoccus radiodurans]|uniref:N-methyl-L-tryptophan oxidase n=1 Tax=Muricoccus radiodurans TaxID=2231721 RepID=UPI003CF57DD5
MSATTAEVLVIGLGAFGSAVLCQLARRGVRAIGIDRFRPPHAMGSSHGETRITRLAVGEGAAYAPLVRRSHAIWRELEREAGEALLHETGGLIMAPRDSRANHHGRENFVRRTIEVAERFDIPHEVLKADEIAARFPQFGLRGDEIGYYEPSAGFLAPERCIATQLHLAQRHGAVLRLEERVLELHQDGDAVRVVTDRGRLEAARCVLTAGAWLPGLSTGPLKTLPRVHRQTLHWFAAGEAAAYAPGRFPVFIWMHGDSETDYFYGFPGAAGGDVKVATETYARNADPDLVDRCVTSAESMWMYEQHVAGRLRGVTDRVTRAAACLYTVTPDSGFVVDNPPGGDRILALSACSGHGFKHSAGLGEAVALRVIGEPPTADLAPFSLDRFALARG